MKFHEKSRKFSNFIEVILEIIVGVAMLEAWGHGKINALIQRTKSYIEIIKLRFRRSGFMVLHEEKMLYNLAMSYNFSSKYLNKSSASF